jgi:hypothetical protein
MIADPRHNLLQTFGCLLLGADTYPAPFVKEAVDLATWAIGSAKRYRRCRLNKKQLGYGLAEDRYEHLGESDRMDLHGRVYLDLALQFRLGEFHGRPVTEFMTMPLGGRYVEQPPLAPDVLRAMRAELWRAHEALVEQGSASPRGGGGCVMPVLQSLVAALAAFTPDRTRPKAGWSPGRTAALRCLSTSDSWVSLVDDEATPSGERRPAQMVPLHVALSRPADGQPPPVSDGEPFGISWYPSLLSSLEYFSSPAVDTHGALGWWATLDAGAAWACGHYAKLTSHRQDSRESLKGRHVARFDLALAGPAMDRDGLVQVVGGASHGAAFALCLMQAVARADTARGG